MSTFADRLQQSISQTNSRLVAGCDPVIDSLPEFLLTKANSIASSDSAFVEYVLNQFCELFVSTIVGHVAAAKPNIAFFERYGVIGLKAFHTLCTSLKAHKIPVIIDAKRGDIGSTAAAYSAAFIGRETACGRTVEAFHGDAVTVNPFLGFDTLEPFLKDCKEYGKGIFVLVQTSNPGAKDLQGLSVNGKTISHHVAGWLAQHAQELQGACGWSGLGAVVGASYPVEAKQLREVMPRNIFLIPGLGAQGASAEDSVAGFGSLNGEKGGALINVSRGLLGGKVNSTDELVSQIRSNVASFNAQINAALGLSHQ
jgi:orotidine-5'-phosphate decarboxylase